MNEIGTYLQAKLNILCKFAFSICFLQTFTGHCVDNELSSIGLIVKLNEQSASASSSPLLV